ncbi:MAG: Ca-activated chloride channel [Acidobacteriota bacterium]|jgi:Ca-activated chloride channel family protein|nr:Ca-activated chloride channel [Acidobacteriota bacterium]
MSYEEQRTTHVIRKAHAPAGRSKARPLSLLILATLALLASSCLTADRNAANSNASQPVSGGQIVSTNMSANAGSTNMLGKAAPRDEVGGGESYAKIDENPFLEAARAPLSTFSIDVDTASYSNTRRFLNDGQMPPKDAVRIEELVNYFTYDYPQPTGAAPFSVTAEVADCPWNAQHRLVHVGLQGKKIATEDLPPANLVFLIDVSGSMEEPRKLPLVKSSLRTLAEQLSGRDRVAIVVYAGNSGLVLPSTPGDQKGEIISALDRLEAGGSTNGGSGIQLAYRVAQDNFIRGGTNRVILATDGDFNVGMTGDDELVRLIEEKRRGGVFLSVLGFGAGNLNDSMMEKLADKGNGNYAYIDTQAEAQKALGEQVGGTLATIAKDVKIQVEFNPRAVAGYRLIGYENRLLAARDFNDDKKDAGEIGAGHTVTALYEIVPAGQKVENPGVDELKYGPPAAQVEQSAPGGGELLTVKLRYKEPDGDVSKPLNVGVVDSHASYRNASENFKFSAAVAEFGMLLRDSRYKGQSSYDAALALARASAGADLRGYRTEFVRLVETAKGLSSSRPATN